MSFKYINPGYAQLLDTGGTTVEGKLYSKTGVALWQPLEKSGFVLEKSPTEIYGRFDAYLPAGADFKVAVGLGNDVAYISRLDKQLDLQIRINGSASYYVYASPTNAYEVKQKTGLVLDAINTIWFNIKSNDAGTSGKGGYTIYANGRKMADRSYSLGFYDEKEIVVYSKNDKALLSNLIISDGPIDKKEQVIILPMKDTETDMAAGEDGMYIASAVGQQLLQAIDTERLIPEYGADSKIISMVTAGFPAYRTAEGLSSLTGISRSGDGIAEHGRKTVSQSTAGVITDTYNVDMTIADMAGMKFGWKAGE